MIADRQAIVNNLENKERELALLQRKFENVKTDSEEQLISERKRREQIEKQLEQVEASHDQLTINSQARINDLNFNLREIISEKERLQKKLEQDKNAYRSLEEKWNGALTKIKELKSWRTQDASEAEELEKEIKRLSSKLQAKDNDWNALLAVLNEATAQNDLSGVGEEYNLSERLQRLLEWKDKKIQMSTKEFEDFGQAVSQFVRVLVDKTKLVLQDDFSPTLNVELEQALSRHKTAVNRITVMEKVFNEILDLIYDKIKRGRQSRMDYDSVDVRSAAEEEIRMLKRRIVSLKHQVKEAYDLESLEASNKEKVMIARYLDMQSRYEEERERHKEDYDAYQARVKQSDEEIQRLRQLLAKQK